MTAPGASYWLLDAVAGWRRADGDGLQLDGAAGDWILEPIPGEATPLEAAAAAALACPAAVAGDARGRALVVEAASRRIGLVDLDRACVELLEGVGGPGDGARHLERPTAIVALPRGGFAVADAARRRVLVFSPPPYALLRRWGDAGDPVGRPVALGVDRCRVLHVLDAEGGQVLRLRPDGERLPALGAGQLHAPLDLAVSADGTVAVVDGGEAPRLLVFPAAGGAPLALDGPAAPRSVAFDAAGDLYLGTDDGVVARLTPDATAPGGWALAGEGVTGVEGRVVRLAALPGHGLLGILRDPSATPPAAPWLARLDPRGATRLDGWLETDPLDSRIERCPWHRVQVHGTVPEGSSLLVETATSEDRDGPWQGYATGVLAGADEPECLVQSAPGRFLKLRLTLRSSGAVSPRVHSVEVHFPRQSYLGYLPAVFQQDPESRAFLERFLSIFQTAFDGVDRTIDDVWQLFDPAAVPAPLLPWLSAWLALPVAPDWTPAQTREALRTAFADSTARGTTAALARSLERYAGVGSATILEHYRLRAWARLSQDARLDEGARLFSRDFYKKLQVGRNSQVGAFRLGARPEPREEPLAWGAHQFSVYFPANPLSADALTARIRAVVEREKPAHTEAFLCPVLPRLRVGVQATVGVDARIGEVAGMVLGQASTLNYDTVLRCSPAEQDLRALGTRPTPRVGVDTRVQ